MYEVIDEATVKVGNTYFTTAIRSEDLDREPGLCVRCLNAALEPGWLIDADEQGTWVVTSSLCVPCMTAYEESIFHAAL